MASPELTEDGRAEIISAAEAAGRRQEHRTYRAVIIGMLVVALVVSLLGLYALVRLEQLIDDVRLDIALNRAEGEEREEELQELVDGQRALIIQQERNTQEILRAQAADEAAQERRLAARLERIQERLVVLLAARARAGAGGGGAAGSG